MAFLVVFSLSVLALLLSSQTTPFLLVDSAALNTLTDKEALLSFKTSLIADPSNSLSTWNQNFTLCNWTGVVCNENSSQRVVGLDLRGLGLSGTVSPHLANLSFLRSLQLQNNQFSGTLPDRIGDLSRLRVLNISSNRIQGEIPRNISRCSELVVLDLMANEILGVIPTDLDRLSKLQVLKLSRNKLSGAIPPSIGNLSSLTTLDLATNSLGGTIPSDLGRLRNLKTLELSINNLTGIVPPSIYNISSLVFIALASNRLWGEIPSDVGDTLPNLLDFNFCINQFTGGFPGSLHNLTKIQGIRMARNFLVGSLPPGLGNLPDLRLYNIGFNRFVSSGDAGLSFITSLTNSTNLDFLAFDDNLLEGVIPESIGNLSTVLTKLYMGGNRIYGNIPASIGRLRSLALLNLSHNSVSGEIPLEISQLKELQILGLAGNKLAGEIPASLGNLGKLTELELFGNELVGRIPTTFGNFQRLLSLDLSNNRLNGSIPKEIFSLSSLSILLNLSKNSLNGPLPQEVGNLENVVTVDLSYNDLFGSIPASIDNCKSLEELFMTNNFFSGHIPDSLGNVKGLETLDLSSNQLSGPIPYDLQKLQALQLLNLSYNNLEGGVPNDGLFRNLSRVDLEGNSKLCLFPSACKSNRGNGIAARIIIAISGSIALCILVALLVCISLYRRKNVAKIGVLSSDMFKGQRQMVSYEELRSATGNFDETNLIGSGSFGSVYKGILREGMAIAVKVLDLGQTGASKSFLAECEALRNARHRNLVKLITSCSSVDFGNVDFCALVYEFMGNGSLDDWGRGRRRHNASGDGLNVVERLNVAIDVASAIDYLHHDSEATVVHCDLKPSNILLDEDMTAKVGDFGLARLLVERDGDHQQSSTTNTYGLKGSIGYIPPEYGLGGKPSTRGDVYSYGIMLLELFTGRSPIHEAFTGGVSIAKWVKSAFPDKITKVLDPNLLLLMDNVHHEGRSISPEIQQECLVSIIGVGLCCAIESPEARISMRDVLQKLKSIRDSLLKPPMSRSKMNDTQHGSSNG